MPRTSRPGAPFRAVKPRSLLALAVASLEASHTTTGVQNLLLAGVEGVAASFRNLLIASEVAGS